MGHKMKCVLKENQVFFAYETLLGSVVIVSDGCAINALELVRDGMPVPDHRFTADLLTDRAALQLDEYLAGSRRQFDLPLAPHGTAFQQAVWNELLRIPYGETRSYKHVAQLIGSPRAFRAVGMANNRNPIMIIIPCHRVIGSNGSLVGYGGGLDVKEMLLGLEGVR